MKIISTTTGIELFVEGETELSDGSAAYRVSKVQGSKMTFLLRKELARVCS